METPVPQLLFAMSGFLIISGGLFAKGVALWLQKRAAKNKPVDVKEVKVDIHVEVGVEETPKNNRTTKQEDEK